MNRTQEQATGINVEMRDANSKPNVNLGRQKKLYDLNNKAVACG